MFIGRTLALAASLLIAIPASGQAGPFIGQQVTELVASDKAASDVFGSSVAMSGDTVVVGSYLDDHAAGSDAGSAYVFVRSGATWTQQAKLIASDATSGDRFGYSVGLSGDTVVVGASGDDNYTGSAYVFVRTGTTWTQQAKLTAADASPNDHFGWAVAVAGDSVVVGAPQDGIYAPFTGGSAYAFVRNGTTWSEQAKLTASAEAYLGFFGGDVSISMDTIVVGAYEAPASVVTAAGAAYVFTRSGTTWSQQAKLTAPDGAAYFAFGWSVAVSGDTALIGSTFDSHDGLTEAGSVFVYVRSGNGWTEQAKLTASSAAAYDYFGTSVDLLGDNAVVGSKLHDAGGIYDAGAAFVYVRTGAVWSEIATMTASDAAPSDDLGLSVAIDGDTVVAGADFGDAPAVTDSGSVYVLKVVPIGQWSNLGFGLAGTAGIPALVSAGYLLEGTPVSLSLTQAKPFSLAPLVVGFSNLADPFKGGTMIPYPNWVFPAFTDFFGKSNFGGLWPSGVPAGFKTYFQWWIQDPAGPKGYAASNAVAGTAP